MTPVVGWLGAGLLGLGVLLRVHNFWVPELWTDEYGTWWIVSADWSEATRRVLEYAGQSPLYYSLVKVFTDVLGAGPASLRLPSILCGIAVLALAYPLGRRIFGSRHAALLTLAAFAVNERLIWYSQDARPYALALVLTMLSFLFFLSLLHGGRARDRVGYVLTTAGLFYASYPFGIAVLVQALYLVLRQGGSWLKERAWVATFAALALVTLPGAAHVAGLFGRREAMDWIRPEGALAPVRLLVDLLDPVVFAAVAFLVLATAPASRDGEEAQGHRHQGLIVLWLLLPVMVVSVVPPLVGVSLLHPRHVLVAAPAGVMAMAWLMTSGGGKGWLRWTPLAACVAVSLGLNLIPSLDVAQTFSRRPNPGWKRAAQYVERVAGERDLVLVGVPFIEGDMLAGPNPDPRLVPGLTWPLTSHFGAGHGYRIIGLPARVSSHTQDYIASVVGTAAHQPRVWIVGSGEVVPYVAHTLVGSLGFVIRRQTSYGRVVVFQAERDAK